MGFKQNVDYSIDVNFKTLRYGRMLLLTDQDVDGSHIKGLGMNFIHFMWPSLLKRNNFFISLATPIVKATKGKDVITFYNLTEYEEWKNTDASKGYKTKYYKGLATSTQDVAKEYFVDIEDKIIRYFWQSATNQDPDNKIDPDDDAISLAFVKNRADDRKEWLMKSDPNKILKYEEKDISYADFINYDLIHFSREDNCRSIPSLIEGFKPSLRKILYGAILRGLDKEEIKVSQLAGFVSDRAAYHHGEASLNGAIINMAQNFVGSNNINVLYPSGQFGTRIHGGKDAGSPRYIFTRLEDLTPKIFMMQDDPILKPQYDDGTPIEPKTYAPIIPMILINGSEGIGTGFSTFIPPFNPKEIITNLKNKFNNKPYEKMIPYYNGFEGTTIEIDDTHYEFHGKYTINDNKLIITELPIGLWTFKYKEFLEKKLAEDPEKEAKEKEAKKNKGKSVKEKDNNKVKLTNPFLAYKEYGTDKKVHFILEFEDGYLQELDDEDLMKEFRLVGKLSMENMYLHNKNNQIQKYDTIEDILNEYFDVRLEFYEKRKAHQLDALEKQLKLISYKVKFILMIVEKKLDVNNKKKTEIEEKLIEHKFPKIDDSYNYLLSMPIYNLTKEKIDELKKQEKERQTEYEILKKMTPTKIWEHDLDEFEKAYDKWCADIIEKEDESMKPVSKKTKKNNKKNKN